MIEALCLVIIGIPIVFVAALVWICVIIAVLDAVRTYVVGESRPVARMLRRWGRE